jgi:hypothetical protein
MIRFFNLWRERFQHKTATKKSFYDICHIDRVTFVTLDIPDKVVDTILVYPRNKLLGVQTI